MFRCEHTSVNGFIIELSSVQNTQIHKLESQRIELKTPSAWEPLPLVHNVQHLCINECIYRESMYVINFPHTYLDTRFFYVS